MKFGISGTFTRFLSGIFYVVLHLGLVVRHSWQVLNHVVHFTNQIFAFLHHLANFLDNGTQFNCIKGLIGSAPLVEGWAISF